MLETYPPQVSNLKWDAYKGNRFLIYVFYFTDQDVLIY